MQRWAPASQSQLKKLKKIWQREQYKKSAREEKEARDAQRRAENMEEAKKITIKQDPTLPKAEQVLSVHWSSFPLFG